jgi:hypothetical protein
MSDGVTFRKFIGSLLMTVGALMASLSGLCTGYFQITFIHDALARQNIIVDDYFKFPVYLPIALGVIPILVGVGLFIWGRYLMRRGSKLLGLQG